MSAFDVSQLFTAPAWDDVSQGYAAFIGDHLRLYAQDALSRLNVSAGDHVLDVATGPGTLSLPAARITRVSALDFSQGMLDILLNKASESELANLTLTQGDGQALPFGDATFDVAFSMFGLFLFPDRSKGFSELARVLKPGGRALVASWQPQDRIPPFAVIGQALMELAEVPPGAYEPPLVDPEIFAEEMSAAGFEVSVEACTHTLEMPDFETMWDQLSQAHVGLVLAKKQLGAEAFAELLATTRRKLMDVVGEGPQALEMPAWFGVGQLG